MSTTTPIHIDSTELRPMRRSEFKPRRAKWPGLLGAAVVAAALITAAMSNFSAPSPTHAAPTQTTTAAAPATAPAPESK